MKIGQAYDRWAATYDEDRNLTRDLDHVALKKTLRGIRPSAVLELGCGTGKNTGYLSRISESVLSLDFSEGMIARARNKIRAPHVAFALADISKRWPCEGSRFDLAACNLVLEHIKDLRFIFSEARRVLRPGGLFFICELHPFRQHAGRQAVFQSGAGAVKVPAFLHNVSDYLQAASAAGFSLAKLGEWWHGEDEGKMPRLISMMFAPGR